MHGDRRSASRVAFRNGHLPPAARVRPGCDVIVVDLSTTGALVEGQWRFRPGSRCELALNFASGDVMVRARVARCFVARLGRLTPVRYRAALAFEALTDVHAQRFTSDLCEVPMAQLVASEGVSHTHGRGAPSSGSARLGGFSTTERRT